MPGLLGWIAAFIVGGALGALVAYLLVVPAKARAEAQAARVPALEQELKAEREAHLESATRVAELARAQEAEQQKAQWLDAAQERLREAFQALAAQSLQSNSAEFLAQARTQLETVLTAARGDWRTQKTEMQSLVKPLEDTLRTLDGEVRKLEEKRAGAYEGLGQQLRQLGAAQQDLHTATTRLEEALKNPTVRGSWGEVQLRRVVELAGMQEHVDFDEQTLAQEGRPDMIVRLPNATILPVDAKAPMLAYLEAVTAGDEETRKAKLQHHARAVRNRIKDLSQRGYWGQFDHAPEFVVLFAPNDACLTAAFEADPTLLEFAFEQRVLPATPVILLALLKGIAYGWQQHQLAENAARIAKKGRELHDRLVKFVEYLAKTRTALLAADSAFDDAVRSFNRRLLPAARDLGKMGAATKEIAELAPINDEAPEPAALEPAEPGDEAEPSAEEAP